MLSIRKFRKELAMIRIDNQVAIKALTSDLRSPGHHLAWKALYLANCIEKVKKKSRKTKAMITI
jgi:hypothetical protein